MSPNFTLHSRFGRVLSIVVIAAFAAGLLVTAFQGRWLDALQVAPVFGLLGLLTWGMFWRPNVRVTASGVTLRNVLRTIEVAWPARFAASIPSTRSLWRPRMARSPRGPPPLRAVMPCSALCAKTARTFPNRATLRARCDPATSSRRIPDRLHTSSVSTGSSCAMLDIWMTPRASSRSCESRGTGAPSRLSWH
ncbi:PH domain-containing protein [Salinibacterium amurskyense]|nr:PH domain-containing protein [Salinibacterium amurskyense]